METPLYTQVEGENGILKVNDHSIEIIRKGFNARLLNLRGTKEILIKDITSIQIKEPGILTNGFIQFSYAGSLDAKGGTFNAAKNENSIVFAKGKLKFFQYLRDLINERRITAQNVNSPHSGNQDIFDQIEKLATLRDKGIVTTEEFEK